MRHATLDELTAGLDGVRTAPADVGTVELIVARPARGDRELLSQGTFDSRQGLVGDRWRPKPAATATPATR